MTIRSMNVTEARDPTTKNCYKGPYKLKTKVIVSGLLVIVALSALAGVLIGSAESEAWKRKALPPDPLEPLRPSGSQLRVFQRAAVCADAGYCSEIGRDVLMKNGSAVDAAIATMFCNGFLNQHSMGIGGGFFMTVFIKEEAQVYTVNAREKAPLAATFDMFNGSSHKASKGPLAVGVPGEVRGMWAAHQRWGKLPWASLIAPTLDICKNGYLLTPQQYYAVQVAPWIKNDPHMRKQFFDSQGTQYTPLMTIMPSEALCRTLRLISERGGNELYNGSLAQELLDDLTLAGSIITADDLRNYKVEIKEAISFPLPDGDVLYAPPPPSSGLILVNILNILSGYNFTKSSISSSNETALTLHRIAEAFKFSYSTRTKIGDMDFMDLEPLIKNVTSLEYGREIREKIDDFQTSNDTAKYGATKYHQPDSGTAHISIIAPNGDAVSMTSSINYYFGAGFATLKTGIIMNNVMDDFSSPGITNYFGLQPSPANFIEPGKRPLSSMSPSIVLDKSGNAKLVIGASGGTKITTAVALVIIRNLWFGQTIKEAIDAPRVHHQIFPMELEYEFGTTQDIVSSLQTRGHGMKRFRTGGSIVCALFHNSTAIYANADFRKGGDVSGLVS